MGKIWLETTDGRLIHLPIVEDDFNSPDDAIRIPTSEFQNYTGITLMSIQP